MKLKTRCSILVRVDSLDKVYTALEKAGSPLSISQISRLAGVAYYCAGSCLDFFEKYGLVSKIQISGKNVFYKVNKEGLDAKS